MADERWISVLPQVFDLLLNDLDRIVDDTSIERLLAWLGDVCSTSDGLKTLLKQKTGVLTFLSSEKLVDKKPCCIGVSFALRLSGILWSKDYNVNDSSTIIDLFVKSRENESVWDEAIVRHGYLSGLQSLTSSSEGQKWLQTHKGCLLTAVGCISDTSMFVAIAARELIAKFLISSWLITISEQDNGYSSDMKWLLELLQKNLFPDDQSLNESQHQKMISNHIVSVLDTVRILLNTNFEVGQEILCTSKIFANCVIAAETADQRVCRKLVDVINGLQMIPRSQNTMDWEKLLSCNSLATFGEEQREAAQKILLTIPLKWYKKGMITLAVDFIAGLSLPNDTTSRCFSPLWPEILSCLINAPIEVLLEKPLENNSNASSEANTLDIGCLVTELLSLESEDLDNNIKKVKKQIQQLLEPWVLSRKCQVDVLLQILYTIKELVTKDTPSYSQHVVQWIEVSLKILVNSAMVSNGDQKLLAIDVKGNVKVIKTTLSVVTVLLQQLLNQPNLTDANRKQFFHVLNTVILVARSSRTDPTVITSTLECIGVLLRQGSFLVMSSSTGSVTNEDSSGGVFPYYQRTKEDLGSLIHLRLRDQRWEVKDSALEFVGRLITLNSEAFSDCVVNPSILSLVWESVDDGESYVRSSAWCCIGHLVCNPGLWAKLKEKEHLTEFAVVKKIGHVLESESEAFPRRSVVDCLIKWSRDQHPIVYAILPKPDKMSEIGEPKLSSTTGLAELENTDSETRPVFSDIIRYAFKDFDWEVKIRGLQLVESIIQNFSDFKDPTQGENSCDKPSRSQECQLQNLPDKHSNNLMALLVDLGATGPLLEAVIDCDSLVCEKALQVISTLKGVIHSVLTNTLLSRSNKTGSEFQPIRNENVSGSLKEEPNESKENSQPIVTPEQLQDVIETSKVLSVESFNALLYRLDVSSLTALCTSIDIGIQKDPVGFLHDILVAARNHDDNLLDCY